MYIHLATGVGSNQGSVTGAALAGAVNFVLAGAVNLSLAGAVSSIEFFISLTRVV